MSGWEAMQQGAPDPFFGYSGDVRGDEQMDVARERQILGSGREDFTPCDGCPDDICALAMACVRSEAHL